jgi:Tol biopolymer transport system component
VLVQEVSSAANETTPEISADGLTLYFASDRAGGLGGHDIYVVTRANRTTPWSPPAHVAELSSAANDSGSAPSATQLVIVMSSGRNGAPDLFVANRASPTAAWGTPVRMDELCTLSGEADPMITAQERALVFISNRPGGMGADDLYLSQRTSTSVPFDPPVLLEELNSVDLEEDPWISADLRYIVFTSGRGGNIEIYEASR